MEAAWLRGSKVVDLLEVYPAPLTAVIGLLASRDAVAVLKVNPVPPSNLFKKIIKINN